MLQAISDGKMPRVIFTTAHDQYALKAFEVHALDYLLKPFKQERFKAALSSSSGALAVDMETAAVAEACHAAGVPMLAVRAISDTAATSLPVPFDDWFDLHQQRPRHWGLIKYLLRHPACIPPFAKFVRGLGPARRALADFLVRFLGQPAWRA